MKSLDWHILRWIYGPGIQEIVLMPMSPMSCMTGLVSYLQQGIFWRERRPGPKQSRTLSNTLHEACTLVEFGKITLLTSRFPESKQKAPHPYNLCRDGRPGSE
nr:hypothetical protein CFP56_24564 [Quercus suber]